MDKGRFQPFLIVIFVMLLVVGSYFLVKRILYAHNIIQAQKFENSNDFMEAINIYRKELASDPENIDLYARLGRLYLRIGEEKKAKEVFIKGLYYQPEKYSFLVNVGLICFRENDFGSAENYFKKALSVKPRDASVHFYLARTFHEEGKGKHAEEEYNKALEYGFKRSRVYFNMAYLYEYTLKDYEKALEYYEKYVSSNGEQKELCQKKITNLRLWVKGQMLEDAGDYEKAIAEYMKALEKEPKSIELLTRIGRVYRKCNKFPEAEKVYVQALNMKKDDYYLLNNLGSLYFSINRLKDARDCWQSAIKVEPVLPNAHFNMAVLYEKEGKRSESEKEYMLALKYGYDASTVFLHLGQLYQKYFNDREKAIHYYQKYVKTGGPNLDEVRKIIDLLQSDSSQEKKNNTGLNNS